MPEHFVEIGVLRLVRDERLDFGERLLKIRLARIRNDNTLVLAWT